MTCENQPESFSAQKTVPASRGNMDSACRVQLKLMSLFCTSKFVVSAPTFIGILEKD
jgi:hypothetical protein